MILMYELRNDKNARVAIECMLKGSKLIIERLGLLDFDCSKVSAYGHFGKAGLPWEESSI